MNDIERLRKILCEDPANYTWQLHFLKTHPDNCRVCVVQDDRGTAFSIAGDADDPGADFVFLHASPPSLAGEVANPDGLRDAIHLRSHSPEVEKALSGLFRLHRQEDLARFATRRSPGRMPECARVIRLGQEHAGYFPGEYEGRFEGGEDWTEVLREFSGVYGIVEKGMVIAHAAMQMINAEVSEVRKVWTHPEWRGRGLAQACAAVATDVCLEHSRWATYSALANNRASAAVARACGFEPIRTTCRWKGERVQS